MKTGGTMNFLRRAGAILMVVAIFVSSCNKYADDFEQINTKLDALAAQVAGVTTLSVDMAALKAQVTALQTAVAALPTATAQAAQFAAVKVETDKILAQIATITTTLTSIANTGTATNALVVQLGKDLKTLSDKVTADNAALKLQIDALATTDVAQSAQLTAILAQNTQLSTDLAAVMAKLNDVAQTGATGTDITALTIKGLQMMLDAQKIQLDQLLANSAMYSLAVNITTDAEVDFYMTKIGVWASGGMVNNTVTINTANITAGKLADLRTITNNIIAVIGGTGSFLDVTTKAGDNLVFGKLTTVTGDYKVTGVDVDDSLLTSVGGNLVWNYDGPYASTALATVAGNLTLTKIGTTTTAPAKVGTTSISLPNVKVTGGVYDIATGTAGVLTYKDATSVELSGGVTSLTVVKATNVKLGSDTYATGLTIQAPLATTVDLSALKKVTTGVLDITAAATANVMLDNFATTTALPINVNITGPATISLPKYVAGLLTSDATTVTLAKHEALINPALAKVTTLTMNSIYNPLNLAAYTKLVTATVEGKVETVVPMVTTASVAVAAANADLTTVNFGGTLAGVNLSGVAKLANVTTAGVVNSFTLNDCDKVAGMTLGHKHYEGGPGSTMIVTNNAILASLTTSCDEMLTLTVQGNAALVSCNFASYVTTTVSGNPTITIDTNKLSAVYTDAIAPTVTTPYVEAKLVSADMASLKAYVALYTAPVLAINLDAVKYSTGTAAATDLITKLGSDAAAKAQWNVFVAPATAGDNGGNDSVGGLTHKKEFKNFVN